MLIDVINNSISITSIIDEKITVQQIINNDDKFQKIIDNKIRLKDAVKDDIMISHILSDNINFNDFIKKEVMLKNIGKDDDFVKIIKQNIPISKKYIVDKNINLNKIINTKTHLKNIIFDSKKKNKTTIENIKKYVLQNDFGLFDDGYSDDEFSVKIKNISAKGKQVDQYTVLKDIIDPSIKLIEIINTNITLGDVISKKKKYTSIIHRINNHAFRNNFRLQENDNIEESGKFQITKGYDNSLIIMLLKYNYVIFFTKKKYFLNKKLGIINYLEKYEILCLQYEYKNIILRELDIINYFIKTADAKCKNDISKDLCVDKMKLIYFFEGLVEPNSVYKKISFSNEELFLPFDKYSIKKIEYKLKAFSQIADKMGAKNIEITYDNEILSSNELIVGIDAGGANLSGNNRVSETTKENIILGFDYTNNSYNFNLNKFDIIDIIENENEFFLAKEEFEHDIDLKFLINDRCINFIKEYSTQLIFKYTNELERKIFSKAKIFGLSLGKINLKTQETRITIKINFLNIYDHPNDVSGYNIYNLKEGFFHLSNLINHEIKLLEEKEEKEAKEAIEEAQKTIKINIRGYFKKDLIQESEQEDKVIKDKMNIYYKIYNFMCKHLIHIQENKFGIETKYNHKENLSKVIEQLINYSMNETEIKTLFYNFFLNNLTYKQFEKLRDLIITPMPNFYDIIMNYYNFGNIQINFYEDIFNKNKSNYQINKLIFNSYQYHMLSNYKLKFIDIMEIYVKEIIDNIKKKYIEQKKKNIYFFKEFIFEHYEQLKNDVNESNLINLIKEKMKNINMLINIIIKKYNLLEHKNENINNILYNVISYYVERFDFEIDDIEFIKSNIKFYNIEYENTFYNNNITDGRYKYWLSINFDYLNTIIKNSISITPEFNLKDFYSYLTDLIINSSIKECNHYTIQDSILENNEYLDILLEKNCREYILDEISKIFKNNIDNLMIMLRPNKLILDIFNLKIKEIIDRIIKLNSQVKFEQIITYFNKDTFNVIKEEYKKYFDISLKDFITEMIDEGFKMLEDKKIEQINSFINDELFYKLKGPFYKHLVYKKIIPVLDHEIYSQEQSNLITKLQEIFIINPLQLKSNVFEKLYNNILNIALQNKIKCDLYYYAELPVIELGTSTDDSYNNLEIESPIKTILMSQKSFDSFFSDINKSDDKSPDENSSSTKLDDNYSLNRKVNNINKYNLRKKRNARYRPKGNHLIVESIVNENKKLQKLTDLDSNKLYEIYSNLLDEEYKLKIGYLFERNNISYFNLPSQKVLYLEKIKTLYNHSFIKNEYLEKLETSPMYNFIAWYGYTEKESKYINLDDYLEKIAKVLRICFTKAFSFKDGLLEYDKDKELLQAIMNKILDDNFSDETNFYNKKIIKPLIKILIDKFDCFITSGGNKLFNFDKNNIKTEKYIPIKIMIDKFVEKIIINYYLSKDKLIEVNFENYNIDIYDNYSKYRLLYKFENLIDMLTNNYENKKNSESDIDNDDYTEP